MAKFKLRQLIITGAVSAACLLNRQVIADDCITYCDPCQSPSEVFIGADLLYWTVCQRNLDYQIRLTGQEFDDDTLTVTNNYKLHFADYGWNAGFRVFAGYRANIQNWELRLIYTYFNNDANGTEPVSDSSESPLLHAKNKLKYRVTDLLLVREYQLSCFSNIRPFVGFRALRLNQDFHLDYLSSAREEDKLATRIHHLDSDLLALGLNGGLDWQWTICDGFGFFAGTSASLLEGDMDNHHTFSDIYSDPTVTLELKDNQCLPVAGYHLEAGASWESCFEICGHNSRLTFAVNYEFNQWFHVPEFARDLSLDLTPDGLLTSTSNSSLALQGVTFRADYRF